MLLRKNVKISVADQHSERHEQEDVKNKKTNLLLFKKIVNEIKADNQQLNKFIEKNSAKKRFNFNLIRKGRVIKTNGTDTIGNLATELTRIKRNLQLEKDESCILKDKLYTMTSDFDLRTSQINIMQHIRHDILKKLDQTNNTYNITKHNFKSVQKQKKTNLVFRDLAKLKSNFKVVQKAKMKKNKKLVGILKEIKKLREQNTILSDRNVALMKEIDRIDGEYLSVVNDHKLLKERYKNNTPTLYIIVTEYMITQNNKNFLKSLVDLDEIYNLIKVQPEYYLGSLIQNSTIIRDIHEYRKYAFAQTSNQDMNTNRSLILREPNYLGQVNEHKSRNVESNVKGKADIQQNSILLNPTSEANQINIRQLFLGIPNREIPRKCSLKLDDPDGLDPARSIVLNNFSNNNTTNGLRNKKLIEKQEKILDMIKKDLDIGSFTDKVIDYYQKQKNKFDYTTNTYKITLLKKDMKDYEVGELQKSLKYCQSIYGKEFFTHKRITPRKSTGQAKNKKMNKTSIKNNGSLEELNQIPNGPVSSKKRPISLKMPFRRMNETQEKEFYKKIDNSEFFCIKNEDCEIKKEEQYINNTQVEILNSFKHVYHDIELCENNIDANNRVISTACVLFVKFIEINRNLLVKFMEIPALRHFRDQFADLLQLASILTNAKKSLKSDLSYITSKFIKTILERMNGNNFNILFKLFFFNRNTSMLSNTEEIASDLLEYILNDKRPDYTSIEPEYAMLFEDAIARDLPVTPDRYYWNSRFIAVFCMTASFTFRNNAAFFSTVNNTLTSYFEIAKSRSKALLPSNKKSKSALKAITTPKNTTNYINDRCTFINSAKKKGLVASLNRTYDQLKSMNQTFHYPNNWKNSLNANDPQIRLFTKTRNQFSSDKEKERINNFYKEYKNLNFKIKNMQINSNNKVSKKEKKTAYSFDNSSYVFDSESTAARSRKSSRKVNIRPFIIKRK